MGLFYRVAKPSEYLVITGWGIKELKLVKKAWIYPGQRWSILDITPVNYSLDVQAMSSEKLPFILPAVFTIGPRADSMDALERYARLLTPHDKLSNHVKDLVQGIIEGETRVLAAGMTMEQVFAGTKEFKREVFDKVQLELNEFGLHIYNANVKQLVDVRGHEYFSYLGQKTQQEAANQAKVDVAEATLKGNVGAKEREGLTRQNIAKVEAETKVFNKLQEAKARQEELRIEAQTKVYENARQAEIKEADAQLATKAANWKREVDVSEAEAAKMVEIRRAELDKELAIRTAAAQTEKLRSDLLAPAVAQYDVAVQHANAELFERQRKADGELYEQQREADATRAKADAKLHAAIKDADAKLYAAKQEAEALVAKAEAEATYVSAMLSAFSGDASAFQRYLLIDRHVYQDMGRFNAEAIQGLNPKISIWSTANTGGDSAPSSTTTTGPFGVHEISNIYKALPPLLTTVHEQTGISPPPWLPTLPSTSQS
jgi:flotillin